MPINYIHPKRHSKPINYVHPTRPRANPKADADGIVRLRKGESVTIG